MSERVREAAKWALKSGGGLAVNLALLTVWVDWLGIWPEVAVGINWLILSVYGYLAADQWVYESLESADSLRGHLTRYLALQGVMASSKLANYLLYLGGLWLGLDYRLAWAGGAVLVFLVSYGGSAELWRSRLGVNHEEL